MKLMPNGRLQMFEWQPIYVKWEVVIDLIVQVLDVACNYPWFAEETPFAQLIKNVVVPQQNILDQWTIANPVRVAMKSLLSHVVLHKISILSHLRRSKIFTMQAVDYYYNGSAFIKVQNVRSHHLATILGSTIGSFVLLLVVARGFVMYKVHKRKRDAEMEEEYLIQVPGMPTRFYYEDLKTATENFSKKLGEGGFGSVFEGSLEDGSKIAVKCLEGLSHVKKSFLAEVESIGSIHHVNLVRLRGFCTWKSQRFLVYDFMSNGSLDKWIYHGVREQILEWECIKKTILDIARGLAYLHEECRQKIVHLDIKPQNILLDNDFNAKVSDFGLSKLIDKSQTEVMTTI
ncbi:putative protein kinase RLK-Pelle-SD-2b family [Helianthus annuus]|nr:putative protein kinase RLK-Pelle-SD-2b family [Helianthus annuus]